MRALNLRRGSFGLRSILAGLLALAAVSPADAIVRGRVTRDPDGLRSSVVRVESSRGELCSGVVIGPDLILTAAHCVLDSAQYRVVAIDRRFRARAIRAVAAAMHPTFVAGTTPRTQPGIDLALLKLEQPLGADFRPFDPRVAGRIAAGDPLTVAGFGTTAYRRKATARTLRETQVVSLGEMKAANRVIVAVDAERLAAHSGAGACQGDSGGPILREEGGGTRLVGIISWSSGAFMDRVATACGGFTAVTPVAEHATWIATRAAELSRLAPDAPPVPSQAGSNPYDWRFR